MTEADKELEGWRVRRVGAAVIADLPRGDTGLVDFEVKLQSSRRRPYFTFYGHQRDIECPLAVIDRMVNLYMEKPA